MDAALHDPGPGRLIDGAPLPDTGQLLRVEATVPLGIDAAFTLFAARLSGLWPNGSPLAGVEATPTLWEPPRRIRATWVPGSHVDVLFAEVDDDLTTVIVEHRDLAAHPPEVRDAITGDDGWWGALRAYVAAARASAPITA